jgi:hypothetical protein
LTNRRPLDGILRTVAVVNLFLEVGAIFLGVLEWPVVLELEVLPLTVRRHLVALEFLEIVLEGFRHVVDFHV